MTKIIRSILCIGLSLCTVKGSSAQAMAADDSIKLDYRKIYSFCLDGNRNGGRNPAVIGGCSNRVKRYNRNDLKGFVKNS